MNKFRIKLFYSYCHIDEAHVDQMQRHMALFRKNGLLQEWYDRKIVPGQKISAKILEEMQGSDVFVFLVSADFLSSNACTEEWAQARRLAADGGKRLVSVIVRDCPWQEFDDMAEYLVLPKDGKPITIWDNQDQAWTDVYKGIKGVIEEISQTFTIKPEFERDLSRLEFCSQSQDQIWMDDLFVFPELSSIEEQRGGEERIKTPDALLQNRYVLIRGEDQSGKTKLCSYIFLRIANNIKPVLFIDLDDLRSKKPNKEIFAKKYGEQFFGEFDLWFEQDDKTVILDNLNPSSNCLGHLALAKQLFDNVIVTTSIDNYTAYFKDELELTPFTVVTIAPLTHNKQEQLIKKWIELKNKANTDNPAVNHGEIDQIERNINAIVINNRVLPRYPFFVLSILQTYEGFMPQNVQITAYGHCYYALILAHLIKAGIDKRDDYINPCFNFAAHLAFEIYNSGSEANGIDRGSYDAFIKRYKERFLIQDSLLSRLCGPGGIIKITQDGCLFSLPYSYYFFLGRYLAQTYNENSDVVSQMVDKSYVRENTLSLIFAIHHAHDIEIIDDILVHTLCAIDNVGPAKLDASETKIFNELMHSIPEQILSGKPVEEERRKERELRDKSEKVSTEDEPKKDVHEFVNEVYKSQKNMEILSQILKNKSGSLEKDKLQEIVETICDAGLRLVNLLMVDEEELKEMVKFIEKRYEESDHSESKSSRREQVEDIQKFVRYAIFLWTMTNIEKAVSSISKPELKQVVKRVIDKADTPAYDIIYYFYSLDTGSSFGESQKNQLKTLLSKYQGKEMAFLQRVLSLRTQYYMNTHRISGPLKQSVSSMLGVGYKP